MLIVKNVESSPAAGPYYAIEPSTIEKGPEPSINQTFTIDVKLYNVTTANVPVGVVGVEVQISWNASLLQNVSRQIMVGQPGGALAPGNFFTAVDKFDTFGNGIDYYQFATTSFNPITPWWGNGTVIKITFKIIYQPAAGQPDVSSLISFGFTDLVDYDANVVPHEKFDATYTILSLPVLSTPTLSLVPSKYVASKLNEVFKVNVTISNLDAGWDMGGFAFRFWYNSSFINASSVAVGAFLGASPIVNSVVNNTVGYVWVSANQSDIIRQAPSGNGTLAIATFKVIRRPPAVSVLRLIMTSLFIWEQPAETIPHTSAADGRYELFEVLSHNVVFAGTTYRVVTRSNSSVTAPLNLAFNSTGKSISFDVTGVGGKGFSNVTIPKTLLDAANLTAWKVQVAGSNIAYTAKANATHTSISFTYIHGTKAVKIIGTAAASEPSVITEIPWLWIAVLVIIVVVALAGVVMWRRRKSSVAQASKTR